MVFFGHLGITTGIMKMSKKVTNNVSIDYRIILIGSILPDLIDKPLGAFLFRSTFHNSRIFGHTLAFSIILLFVGLILLNKYKNKCILLLGICSVIHLILDSMWFYPSILFWPYFGWRFPVRPEGNWIKSDILRLLTDPAYYIPEIIGFLIILYYFVKLVKSKQIRTFINKGRL